MKKEFSKIHNIGMFDGKFPVEDDIDFCNDEIAEMFGVSANSGPEPIQHAETTQERGRTCQPNQSQNNL